jgi:hypothetical protein
MPLFYDCDFPLRVLNFVGVVDAPMNNRDTLPTGHFFFFYKIIFVLVDKSLITKVAWE